MRTSAKNRNLARQRGVTLLELLIALSILSLGAVIAASALNNRLPQQAVKLGAEQLIADLKRARLDARTSNEAVTVTLEDRSYRISTFANATVLPNGVSASRIDDNDAAITFSSAFAHLGGEILIEKGEAKARILVHPITGKIERID